MIEEGMSDKFHLIVRPSNFVVSGQIIHGRLRKHLFYCLEESKRLETRTDQKRAAVMRNIFQISKAKKKKTSKKEENLRTKKSEDEEEELMRKREE